MALRVFLVGLVGCLGLDLPSVEELASWKTSSQDWVAARMADLASFQAEAGRISIGPLAIDRVADCPPGSGRADLIFEAVVEGMASGFAVDLAATESNWPAGEAFAAVEPSLVVTEISRDEPSAEPVAAPAPVVADIPPPPVSRLERISEAVRLTRQAVDAWSSLIQPLPEAGRGDSL